MDIRQYLLPIIKFLNVPTRVGATCHEMDSSVTLLHRLMLCRMETAHPALTVQVEFWAQTMIEQFLSINTDITHPCICPSPVQLVLVKLEQCHDQVQCPKSGATHASRVSSPCLFFWQL